MPSLIYSIRTRGEGQGQTLRGYIVYSTVKASVSLLLDWPFPARGPIEIRKKPGSHRH